MFETLARVCLQNYRLDSHAVSGALYSITLELRIDINLVKARYYSHGL